MGGKLKVEEARIANGASLATELDLSHWRLVGINMPSSWTTANLTFKGRGRLSGTAGDVYDSDGTELTITAAASRFIVPTPAEAEQLNGIAFLTVRSGTTGTPVAQGAARTLVLVVEPRA